MDEQEIKINPQELTDDLEFTLNSWVQKKFKRVDAGIEISNEGIDAVINGLIMFTAAKLALIQKEWEKNFTAESMTLAEFTELSIQKFSDHFKQVLTNHIKGNTHERASES